LPAAREPRVRLQKVIAAAGIASRRGAEDLLRAGRVRVNGEIAAIGDSVDPDRDRVSVDGRSLHAEPPAYWVVHKPRGVLTTVRDTHGRRTVLDLLPDRTQRLFPVGRLDLDTEGLVLLTNDGELAHVLMHPSFESEREYEVEVRGRVSRDTLRHLAKGVTLDDGLTAPATASHRQYSAESDTSVFRLVLIEGKKRQIRRALAFLRHPVVALLRVRLGPLRLGKLAAGEARALSDQEIAELVAHAAAASPEPRRG
jgi:23S rRNA pseudouridine2605 synthase